MKIIGVGDSVMDAYLHEGKLYPGGNSVNVPVLARRFGAVSAGYIGIMGDDLPGRHFLQALREEGLDISRVRVVHAPTAQNFIRIDETGDRHFVGNNGQNVAQLMTALWLRDDDFALMERFDLIHTSVHSWLEHSLPAMARRTPVSLDFSDGYNARNIEQLCPLLRFAFFSGGDKSDDEVNALGEYALRCGARTVVVTRGMRGSCVFEEGARHVQGVVRVNAVDALGAGDAYIAAFLTHYLDHGGDLSAAAEAGAAYAARCCGHQGAFGRSVCM